VIEAKIIGRGLTDLKNGLGRILSAAKSLTKDGRVDEIVLSPAMTQAAYVALHGEGWPEDGPNTPSAPTAPDPAAAPK